MTDDRWFGNAEEIKAYLEKLYEDDISKRHHIISLEETALKRKEIQEYHVLNGMRLNHMISINADGLFNRVNVLTEDLLNIGNQEVDVVEEMNLQLQDIFLKRIVVRKTKLLILV